MNAEETINAIEILIRTHFMPDMKAEMQAVADAAVCRYRSAVLGQSSACCEQWALFYYDMDNNSRFVPSNQFGRKTISWAGHTFVCCPFCGKRLDSKGPQ